MDIIDKNINKAQTLHSRFYTDDDIFEKSKIIFESSSQLICSIDELKNISIYPFEYFPGFLEEHLIIINNNNNFTYLSNVCTHRGHLISLSKSKDCALKCAYHGRTFNLNGTLKNAPGFQGALKFPRDDDNLDEISIENWNNFLFISLQTDSNVIKELSQIDRILPNFPYSQLSKKPDKYEYEIDCHWAIYCDNYLEGFHVPYIHQGLNDDIDWKKYKTRILDKVVLQTASSKNPNDSIDYDDKNNIYAYYFFIFPNIMINYYKWGISINIIEPISKNKTRIKYMIYNLKGYNIPKSSLSSVDTVELEDQKVVLNVQKGIKSRYYNYGRFAPEMEKGVHYFHRLISEKILK